jgi:NAD(P)-dependent dehydrogenase (short-subunit alcohol dehydrogenase family)
MMDFGLKGKTVAITGGSAGIGKAVAMGFSKEECNLAICGRSKEKLGSLSEAFGKTPLFVKSVDVADNEQLAGFADDVWNRYGRIDVWINNVGLSDPRPFNEVTEEDFDKLININLKSVFFGTKFASNYMKKTGGGVIINTSSFTSLIPTAGKALYGATKAALDNLTKSFAAEMTSSHIRVVSVIPGYIRTELTQENINENNDWLVSNISENRLGTPEDLVGAYLFLASSAADYITGVSLQVSGGKFCVQNPFWSWDKA